MYTAFDTLNCKPLNVHMEGLLQNIGRLESSRQLIPLFQAHKRIVPEGEVVPESCEALISRVLKDDHQEACTLYCWADPRLW
mmetsp:Transcript_2904/g.6296  ORF Transcript_2904/g.6296 Transcript_2904/m.6296 type:complete len:82 (-) Transcript_2904:234-479(-)